MQITFSDIFNYLKTNNIKQSKLKISYMWLRDYDEFIGGAIIDIINNKDHFILEHKNNKILLYKDKIIINRDSNLFFFLLANMLLIQYVELKDQILDNIKYHQISKDERVCYESDNNLIIKKKNDFLFYKNKNVKFIFMYMLDYDIELLDL